MNLTLDPVWPWSRLWDVLLAVPVAERVLALLAAAMAGALVGLWLTGAKVRRTTALLPALFTVAAMVLFARHAFGPALADARALVGDVGAYPLAVLLVVGLVLLLLAAPVLLGLAAGSYLGVPRGATTNVSSRKRFVVLALRLLAFVLVFVALARPAFAWTERAEARSLVLLALDASRSMTITDEDDGSRWKHVLAQLEACRPVLDRLRDEGVDVRMVRFGDAVADFDPARPGEADGARTDFAGMLHDLFEGRDPRLPPRALLVVSDGADNGQGTMQQAERWRAAALPVHTFAVGKPNTTSKQDDVAITAVGTSPQPFVAMKAKLTVEVTIDARGYENRMAKVRLFLEDRDSGKDVQVLERNERLRLTTGNKVVMECDAPDRAGEYKVKVRVETDPPDRIPANNVIETFVTVAKEGVSVLLVDRSRPEAVSIYDALASARVQVTPVWWRGRAGGRNLLKLDSQKYDAIILGDVTPGDLEQMEAGALEKIEQQLARGTGLLMTGGYRALGPEWKGTKLGPALPIDLTEQRQDDRETEMVPTADGLRDAGFLLRLDEAADPTTAWAKLNRRKLKGRTRLKVREPALGTEKVLATTPDREPLLIGGLYARPGEKDKTAVARVLVFGGDTTHTWMRDEESQRLFARFWKQTALWLGRQEELEGGVWVRPDAATRRIPVRSDLTFQAGIRGKGGSEVTDVVLEAEVVAPGGARTPVPLSRSTSEVRGVFAGTRSPGVYRVVARGHGMDGGAKIEGEASARVIVYEEDVEMLRAAADEELLKKLATWGGGEAYRVEELKDVLARLAEQPQARDETRRHLSPDWRTTARSGFLTGFVLVFCAVACLEWGLRRLWGMV